MKNIESLKNYVGNVTEEDFMILATKIYMITDFIYDDYPKLKEWYFTKQLPAIIGEERNILEQAILENGLEEKLILAT